MKELRIFGICICVLLGTVMGNAASKLPSSVTMSKVQLENKIKGGWAGQTIGVSFGSYTEFRYQGTFIQDYQTIPWGEGYVQRLMDSWPDLYDDIYMDLTFVDVLEKKGLDASVKDFAVAFATADYNLWHANQAARYNILNGIMPPESGHWKNNPHADDIDYQIEADYAGLMSPGMPNAASEISDKIGHIMNYGDGWYGGVYVGAMYTLAFVSDDIEYIVTEALKTIPQQSLYYQCINDVIQWYRQYPDDWKQTWLECEKKYSEDKACPEGIFVPFNIDATINSAYIVMGLLYGQGDFAKTMDIATRCGQDSDCNPASAAGILGTMLGYSHIPEYWMPNLKEVEDMDFAYTTISLNKAYKMSFDQALQVIERNGGKVETESVTIKTQVPTAVRYEKSFEGLYPVEVVAYGRGQGKILQEVGDLTFEGTGLILAGNVRAKDENYVAVIEAFVDGQLVETIKLPASYRVRRHELFWKYGLPKGKHTVSFKWLNPVEGADIRCSKTIIFSDTPRINQR